MLEATLRTQKQKGNQPFPCTGYGSIGYGRCWQYWRCRHRNKYRRCRRGVLALCRRVLVDVDESYQCTLASNIDAQPKRAVYWVAPCSIWTLLQRPKMPKIGRSMGMFYVAPLVIQPATCSNQTRPIVNGGCGRWKRGLHRRKSDDLRLYSRCDCRSGSHWGVKSIARVAGIIVPIMASVYIIGCHVISMSREHIPFMINQLSQTPPVSMRWPAVVLGP